MSRWFRSYIGTARDPKFVGVAVKACQTIERVLFVWQCLLESAAEKGNSGAFIVNGNEIAYFLRCDTKDYDAILDAMQGAALIDGNQIVRWSDRQFLPPKDGTNALRQARYREKHNTVTQESNAVTNGAPSVSVSGSDQSESRKGAISRARVDELFERFMKAFPKRENRKVARSRFEAALKAGVDPERIIARAAAYAEEMKFTERRFIKAPDAWLNAGKYDDELPTEPSRPPARAGPRSTNGVVEMLNELNGVGNGERDYEPPIRDITPASAPEPGRRESPPHLFEPLGKPSRSEMVDIRSDGSDVRGQTAAYSPAWRTG